MNDSLDPSRTAFHPGGRTAALTLAALCCFAMNSLLCRAALGGGLIDAESFTLVRLTAGAAVLGFLARGSVRSTIGGFAPRREAHLSALALFLYALPFSLAYLRIEAGTGAFVVFGSVQITMIGSDLLSGRRLGLREGLGLTVALLGLAWLTRPGSPSPDGAGCVLMAVAGFAWGIYSIRGRRTGAPLQATARNFALAVPLAVLVRVLALESAHVTTLGLGLGLISGGITSGLGYVAWYAVLPALGATHASIIQLTVPPLAAMLGVVLLGETLTPRLLVAAPLILVGIALSISAPSRRS